MLDALPQGVDGFYAFTRYSRPNPELIDKLVAYRDIRNLAATAVGSDPNSSARILVDSFTSNSLGGATVGFWIYRQGNNLHGYLSIHSARTSRITRYSYQLELYRIVASRGTPGEKGDKGDRGERGPAGTAALSEKAQEVINSFTGNVWETPSTSLVANTFYATKAAAQAARATATFVNSWSKGPADDNKFMLVRVPKADKNTEVTANRYRTRFGSTDEAGIRVTSDNWEHFFDGTTYSYYTVPFHTIRSW